MAQAEVGGHVESSGAAHARMAWRRATEMEEKVGEQGKQIAQEGEARKEEGKEVVKQREENAGLRRETEKQRTEIARLSGASVQQTAAIGVLESTLQDQQSLIAALQKRSEALTHVFTWSTDSSWTRTKSLPYTFTDGIHGHGLSYGTEGGDTHQFMGFVPEMQCTMHFK